MCSLITYCVALLMIVGLIAAPATQAERGQPLGSGEIPVQRFLGEFEGTAVNTTMRQNGSMKMKIDPSDSDGQVQVSLRAGDGLVGEGVLIGEIATDGQLRARGTLRHCTLLGGCSEWKCKLTGVISGDRLTGNYELGLGSGPGTVISQWEEQQRQRPPSRRQKGRFDVERF